MSEILSQIKEQIDANSILLYMKGSPEAPKCGFSMKASQCLIDCKIPFAFIDILENPEIRSHLPQVSDWPTFPQLFVKGELVGGCDIISEMHQNQELKALLETTQG